jgi:hypothetical protein
MTKCDGQMLNNNKMNIEEIVMVECQVVVGSQHVTRRQKKVLDVNHN